MEKEQLSDFLNLEEKEDETSKVYIGSGLSCLHGATYQLKLLMLFLLRAIHKGYSFYLATEIEAADKFDDVVFQYMENGEKVHLFVQAKHKQGEGKRIQVEHLINIHGNAEFYLPKYFISYLKIKHNIDFTGSVLRDFVLCTNIELDLDPSTADDKVKRLGVHASASNQITEMFVVTIEANDDFFIDSGTRYRLYYDNNDIISRLKDSFVKVLEEEINKLKRRTGRLQSGLEAHQNKELNQIQHWIREFKKITSDNIDEEIKAFFDSLILAVGQPNEIKLTHIIKSELSQEFNTFNTNYVYARFQEVMTDWLKDRRGYFLTQDDGSKFFDKLRVEVHGHFLINVQSPVESFFGRDEELKTLHNLINQGGPTVVCQPISISGLGGIGKTELVRKYISEYGKHYDNNILWIEAESYESMKASFMDLARVVLGVACQDLDIKSVLRETYSFFAKRRCLFVFDNADAFKTEDRNTGIVGFLPSSFLPRRTNTPKVLITSRNQTWGDIPQLVLKTFQEQEALDFIKFQLGIEDESQDADVRNLAEILQYFPLALQQAVAYVKEKSRALKNVGSEFKIIDYINRYKQETKNLLDFKFPKDSRDSYTKTTFAIMKITIFRIKENKEYGEQAGQILDIIALLAPDNIPVEMFLELDLIQNNKEKLGAAIELLKQYSLINSGQVITQLNVHRLVQQVTRIILKKQKREENTFRNVMKILLQMFKSAKDLNNYVLIRQLLTHSESFLSYLDSWSESHPKNKSTVDSYFLQLYPFLTDEYHNLSNFTRQMVLQKRALDLFQKRYGNNNIIVTAPLFNLSNAFSALGHPKKQKELLERVLEIQENHFGKDNFKTAVTLGSLSNAYCDLGQYNKQKELLERALKIQEKHYGSNHFKLATTLVNLSTAHGALGHLQEEKELLERSLNIEEKHYGSNHIQIAITLVNLSCTYGEQGLPLKQKELLERALKIQEKHYGSNHFELATTLVNLSNTHGALGHLQEQKELLERVLKIQEKHYGSNHFKLAVALASLGNTYGSLGDLRKQQEFLEKALKIQEKHYGSNHIELAGTIVSLGNAYGDLGDPRKQKEFLEKALKIQEKHFGSNHFMLEMTLLSLGSAYGTLGDLQTGKEVLERALNIQEKHYGSNNFRVGPTLHVLGNVYGDLGDPRKQKEFLEKVLKIQEKHFGSNHFMLEMTLLSLGIAYGTLGDLQTGKEILERALNIQEKHYGSNHFRVGPTLHALGNAYGDLGDRYKQKELLERALEIREKHYGKNHFRIAVTLTDLGDVYRSLGDLPKQKEVLERAMKIQENHYGKT